MDALSPVPASGGPATHARVALEEGRRPRRWVLRLTAFWVLAAIAVAVLPMTVLLTYSFLRYPAATLGNPLVYNAGVLVWFLIVTVPIATAVGVLLGLASAVSVRVTGLWKTPARRWRWMRYLGPLLVAYAVVIATVAVLAPTAVQPVTSYAGRAALIAVASCFYLRWQERRWLRGWAAP